MKRITPELIGQVGPAGSPRPSKPGAGAVDRPRAAAWSDFLVQSFGEPSLVKLSDQPHGLLAVDLATHTDQIASRHIVEFLPDRFCGFSVASVREHLVRAAEPFVVPMRPLEILRGFICIEHRPDNRLLTSLEGLLRTMEPIVPVVDDALIGREFDLKDVAPKVEGGSLGAARSSALRG